MENFCQRKPDIAYPCPWLFKVIGCEREALAGAIVAVVGDVSHTLTPANASCGGKYHSFNLELLVESESHRDRLYRELAACGQVKVVL